MQHFEIILTFSALVTYYCGASLRGSEFLENKEYIPCSPKYDVLKEEDKGDIFNIAVFFASPLF